MIITTTAGRVRGSQCTGYAEFLGIPYADPPVHGNRFRPPVPVTPWDGDYDATAYGATAPRPPMADGMLPEPPVDGANCLNLNVYPPAPARGSLPVLVWIHGGGFITGGNSSPWYHGGQFARDGIVFAAVNYRLGAEGFLLTEEGANRGILDMIQALRWIRENIEAFGGDPDQVTIAGQSAGAMSCLALLACPAATGLFRRVAAFSPGMPVLATPEEAGRVAAAFCAELGVPARAADLSEVDLARRLRAEGLLLPDGFAAGRPRPPADERAARTGADALSWRPVLDGEVIAAGIPDGLRDAPVEALLIGATTEEFNFTLWPAGPPPREDACRQGFANLGFSPRDAGRYHAAAPSGSWGQALAQAHTDARFRLPVRRWADASAVAGRPTYAYQFAWRSPAPLGAAHCLDLPFFFGNLGAEGTARVLGPEPPADLATVMHGALVRFVRSGDPGWPRYETPDRKTMVFDHREQVIEDPFPPAGIEPAAGRGLSLPGSCAGPGGRACSSPTARGRLVPARACGPWGAPRARPGSRSRRRSAPSPGAGAAACAHGTPWLTGQPRNDKVETSTKTASLEGKQS
jgi:para-nitrobenzyl esterase